MRRVSFGRLRMPVQRRKGSAKQAEGSGEGLALP
jgi:hypothetical protein